MKLPLTPEIEAIARRVVWFEEPSRAIEDPVRFLAYAYARATHDDFEALRKHLSDDDFREALSRAPPGIIDARSWAYWNLKFGRFPPPKQPTRKICE